MGKPEPNEGEVVYELEVELDPLYEWRVARFSELGFDAFTATRFAMAEPPISHHEAKKLADGGCPLERIYDILS